MFLLGVTAVDDLGYLLHRGCGVLRHARVLCGQPAALLRHSFTLNCHRISHGLGHKQLMGTSDSSVP